MAVRLSRATGNWLTAGTWGLVDATSYVNSETTTTALTTSYQANTGVTTGVITVDGVALKLSVRTGTTGTMSVHLAIAGVEVTGTLVTINTADLPVASTIDLNGGWVFFKFTAPVALVGATSYTVEAKTSSASQVSLFSVSGSNWAVAYSTTTTGAPAAGDDVIVAGEYTGAGTSNAFTVTMDETATTDYGAASTSLVTPSLAVCSKGILKYGTTAATNYYLRQSGNAIVYSGGEFDIGTTGTPIPRDSSAILNFDCGANVDFGLTLRNLSTFVSQGLSRTSGKNVVACKLTADIAVNATSFTAVDTDTGWLDNDVIAVASTTRTASQCESGTLNGAAGASSLTVDGFAGTGGGVANAHSGTSPTQAEVILLTRNVQIFGASASFQSFIDIKALSSVDIDWTEFKWLGSATTNKRGIDVATSSTGTLSIQFSSLHDFTVSQSSGFFAGSGAGNFTFSSNVGFGIHSRNFQIAATTLAWTADSNIFMKSVNSLPIFDLQDVGGTFTNNTAVGGASNGFSFGETNPFGTISGNTSHSNAGIGVSISNVNGGTMSTTISWRNSGVGVNPVSVLNAVFDTVTVFGNTTENLSLSGSVSGCHFISVTANGDTTFSTGAGVGLGAALHFAANRFTSCNFGTASGILTTHSTADITCSTAFAEFLFVNCKFGSATEVSSQSSLQGSLSYLASQKHDQTAGLHKTWKKYGTIAIETTTVHTGSQSFKMTPNNASNKLESGSFYIPVTNGTSLTPTVYVYEDASYNGARSRLILKRNDAIGITSDTVIDTATAASDAAWEGLTGTTATATDDGVMEFVIDCDGTAGNLFVDSFTVA